MSAFIKNVFFWACKTDSLGGHFRTTPVKLINISLWLHTNRDCHISRLKRFLKEWTWTMCPLSRARNNQWALLFWHFYFSRVVLNQHKEWKRTKLFGTQRFALDKLAGVRVSTLLHLNLSFALFSFWVLKWTFQSQ